MPSPQPSPLEESGTPSPPSPSPNAAPNGLLTLRALISTKDAGVIIGKGGKNVGELRDQTGVKAGVSKVIPGVHERVLSITGSVEHVAQAYSFIISQLLKSSADPTSSPALSAVNPTTSLRLLISHNLMGSIIGRNGAKIKSIQDTSGARMVASKDMLPQSTERVVEVQGSAENIERAIVDIGRALLEDWERGTGTVLYHPGTNEDRQSARKPSTSVPNSNGPTRRSNGSEAAVPRDSPSPVANGAPLRTQNISIPSDMVGCIIGRGGTKITEIRRLSGAKISIAKTPHDETGERMFTIIGTPEANEKALFLLYNQLESEKERRVGKDQQSSTVS